MVRFIRCNFTGGESGAGGGGGGIDVDTSFLDVRQSSFKGIKAPPWSAADGLGAGVWGGVREDAGAAMRMGAVRWHVGGEFVAAARQRSIHRLAPQVYMATTLMEKNACSQGGAVAVRRGSFYCQVRAHQGRAADSRVLVRVLVRVALVPKLAYFRGRYRRRAGNLKMKQMLFMGMQF